MLNFYLQALSAKGWPPRGGEVKKHFACEVTSWFKPLGHSITCKPQSSFYTHCHLHGLTSLRALQDCSSHTIDWKSWNLMCVEFYNGGKKLTQSHQTIYFNDIWCVRRLGLNSNSDITSFLCLKSMSSAAEVMGPVISWVHILWTVTSWERAGFTCRHGGWNTTP